MRQNHTGLMIQEVIPEMQSTEEQDDTYVKWVDKEVLNGVEKSCNPSIRFRCLMFSNNTQHSIYLHAEPQRNSDNQFMRKIVTFKIYEVNNGVENRVDAFTRE